MFIPDSVAEQLQSGSGSREQDSSGSTMDDDGLGAVTWAADAGSKGKWYHFVSSTGNGDGCSGGGGIDNVEFLLAAGPGEPMRPLSSVASGGESARIMLALKAATSTSPHDEEGSEDLSKDPSAANSLSRGIASTNSGTSRGASSGAPVLILDELDSSIGARLGSAVGRILRRMCAPPRPSSGQIICVTHLPQVWGMNNP